MNRPFAFFGILLKYFCVLTLVIFSVKSSSAQSVSIVSPATGTSISVGYPVVLDVDINANSRTVRSVTYNIDGGTTVTLTAPDYSTVLTGLMAGAHTINATFNYGSISSITTSSTITITAATNVTSSNYAFSKPITLNTSSITNGITTTLSDFPALIYVKDDALKTGNVCGDKVQFPTGTGGSSAAGTNYDFAFTLNGSTNELNYQVDTYDSVNGILLAWVLIPSVTSTNTNLTFYFGSQSPAHSVAFSAATWPSDYLAVYHFSEGSSSAVVLDATKNGRNALQTNTTITNDEIHVAAGIPVTGGAYNFNGTASIIQNAGTKPDITSKFTISAWVNYSGTATSDNKLVSNELDFGHGYKLSVKNSLLETETRTTTNPTPGNLLDAGAVQPSTWKYIQGEFDGSIFINYINGVAASPTKAGAAPEAGSFLTMGLDHGSGTANGGFNDANFYNGTMDEVRISSTAKSADWVNAEFYNQSNPLTFTNFSSPVSANAANGATLKAGALVYTWTGATDTDPTKAANWDLGSAPDLTSGKISLVIPAGKAQYPLLTANGSIYALTIAAGGKFNLGTFTLNVGCNIYNNATTAGTGILNASNTASGVNWNGSLAAQTYTGTNNPTTAELGNMTINNTSAGTVTITGGPVDVFNQLTLTKGNLVIDNTHNGALTLKSSATQTAGVATIPTAYSVTGTVNVERFITGGTGYRGYRILSSPVNAGTAGTNKVYSINYIATSTYVSGSGFGTSATTMPGNPSFYLYRENLVPLYSTFLNSNNRGIKSISASPNYTIDSDPVNTDAGNFNIPIGDGFLYFFRGGISTSNPYNSSSTPVAATVTAKGTLNQGPVQVVNWYTPTSTSLGYTVLATPGTGNTAIRGLNMVGNPYASSIDLSTFSSIPANAATAGVFGVGLMSTVWELIPGTNTYGTYNLTTAAILNNGSNIIASGQGFFVKATTNTASLRFNENAKVAAQPTFRFLASTSAASTAYSQYMILNMAKDTTSKMEILIGFNDGSGKSYNQVEDDQYFSGQSASQYLWITSKDNYALVSKWMTLPKAGQADTVNVNVWATTSGQYAINRTTFKAIPDLYDVWLMDNYKKDSVNLKQTASYPFNIDLNDTASYSAHRFLVITRQNPALAVQLLNFTAAKVTGGVQINWKTANEEDYTGFTVERSNDNGTTFTAIGGFTSTALGGYSLIDNNPLNGANIYRLKITDLDGAISYSKIAVLIFGNGNVVGNNISVYPNPAKNIINLSIATGVSNEAQNTGSAAGQPGNTVNPVYGIKIVGSTGSVIKTTTITQQIWQTDISRLMPGAYFIQVINNNDKSLVGKASFIKL